LTPLDDEKGHTMSAPLGNHHGRWTVTQLRELPEDEFHRYEIDDGVLIVSPRPAFSHQRAAKQLIRLIDDAIEASGAKVESAPEVDTIIEERDDWLKVPDIIVVDQDAADCDPQSIEASDIVLAVEISGTRQSSKRDFSEKLDAYANAGIEHYWILELHPKPKLTVFHLEGEAYEMVEASSDPVHLDRPFPIDVDPGRLTASRRTR
jgi:Uma2 family endonuclease